MSILSNSPDLWQSHLHPLVPEEHKYDRGSALILGGGIECTGAARLAAIAALRSGCGLSTIACPASALMVYASTVLSVMAKPYRDADARKLLLQSDKYHTLCIGPGHGVGDDTRKAILDVLATGKPCVLDADALTSFAGQLDVLIDAIHPATVITPHEGEFERLFGSIANREEAASAAARQLHCIVLLKGAETLIATPDGRLCVNRNAPPCLATAGSGDVLSGIITGLLAQGMPPFEAASAAAWVHAHAADAHGIGMLAEDLLTAIPEVLRGL